MYALETKALVTQFHKDIDRRAALLYRNLAVNIETLHSLAILYHKGQVPSYPRFQYEARKILKRHPEIIAFSWVPNIKQTERALYESRIREFFPDFDITHPIAQGNLAPREERSFYYPVYFLTPMTGNEAALGFDLTSSTRRLKALERSRDTAELAATASINLVNVKTLQKGMLISLPIYRGNPLNLTERRKQLLGFILGVYRIEDLFTRSVLQEPSLGIEMTLVDESVSQQPEVLHFHRSRSGTVPDSASDLVYRKQLPDIWGRTWSLKASPTPYYIESRRNSLPYLLLPAVGILITLLTTLLIHILFKQAETIKQRVLEKTHALSKANRKLQLLSRTDSLTGIANRRGLDEALRQEWQRAIRSHSFLSILLIDIDCFKQYNDFYGHPAGDAVLRTVAEALKQVVHRPGDLVARYGGEEFAVLLTETEKAHSVAENCRQAIAALKIPHQKSFVVNLVTASVGLTTLRPSRTHSLESFIETADQALYQAKASGRNRIAQCSYNTSNRLASS
jgi:diguanylate cyclase (GGDEF)-like protein